MKRFETYKLGEIVDKFNVFQVPWINQDYHKKYKKLILTTIKLKLIKLV